MNPYLLINLVSIGLLFVIWRRYRRERAYFLLKISNQNQIIEALGDFNRWFASQKLGRRATDEEAVFHYGTDGGAVDYARRHRRPLAKPAWPRLWTTMSRAAGRFRGRRNLFVMVAA